MTFKIPTFTRRTDALSIWNYFNELVSRWSKSDLLKSFDINLPVWDMDTTDSINILLPVGINVNTIRDITLLINNDDSSTIYFPGLIKDGIESVTINVPISEITLSRVVGGVFDSTDFNDTSISRGKIIIWTSA